MTTDEEQDLLRAMLVMTAAGLDAMVKELIRCALPSLVERYEAVRDGLEKFVARQIRGDSDTPEVVGGVKFLARLLTAPNQQVQVVEEYIRELTGASLQSPHELVKATTALGVNPNDINLNPRDLKPIFDIRNQIIHELDVNLDGERRRRNIRGQTDMRRYSNGLLSVAQNLIEAVDGKLANAV